MSVKPIELGDIVRIRYVDDIKDVNTGRLDNISNGDICEVVVIGSDYLALKYLYIMGTRNVTYGIFNIPIDDVESIGLKIGSTIKTTTKIVHNRVCIEKGTIGTIHSVRNSGYCHVEIKIGKSSFFYRLDEIELFDVSPNIEQLKPNQNILSKSIIFASAVILTRVLLDKTIKGKKE